MSNRLTFSLASLFLIFAMAFVPTVVIAAAGGPTVAIDVLGTPERNNIDVKFTFSTNVTGFGSATDATWQLYDKDDVLLGSSTALTPAADNTDTADVTEDNPKVWFDNDIDVTTAFAATPTAVGVLIYVPADQATSTPTTTHPAGLGNQANTKKIPLPPLVAEGTLTLSVAEAATQDPTTAGKDYVLTVAYKTGSPAAAATPSTVPTVDHLTFDPAYVRAAVLNGATGALTLKTGDDAADGLYDLPIVHPTGAPPIMIGVQPSYIRGVTAIRVPPLAPVTENPPAAAITVSGLNETDRTFRVEVTFTPAAKSDGSAGSPIKGFDSTKLDIKDASTPPAAVLTTVEAERKADNSYTAILKYDQLSTLPLAIKVDQSEQKTSNPDHSAMVGMAAPVTPTPTDKDPSVAIVTSNHMPATQQFRVQVTITPGDKADGSAGDPITTAFGLSNLKVTDADDVVIMPTVVDDRFTAGTATSPAGVYVAILQYNPLAVLPLEITTADDFKTSDDPKTTAMVPPGTVPVQPTDPAAPGKPAAPTAVENADDDLVIDVSWMAPTDMGDTAITGYVLTKYDSDGGVVKTFPETPAADMLLPATPTTYEVGPVPAADRGMSFTFTVTAWNGAGAGEESDMSAAYMIPAAPVVKDTENPTVEITVLSKDANGKHMVDPAGTVRFEILFSESLWTGEGPNQFEVADLFIIGARGNVTLSDPIDTGETATTGPGNQEKYVLTVPVIFPDPVSGQEVEVQLLGHNLLGAQVADVAGNKLLVGAASKFDTIPPDVKISVVGAKSVSGAAYTFSGEPMAELTFLFDFTEELSPAFTTTDIHRSVGGDNFTLGRRSDPRPVPGVDDAYTVIVTVKDVNIPTTVLIKRLEVADAAKNQLQQDRWATYAPTTQAPVAVIASSSPFYCGVRGNPITVTITDNESIKAGEAIAMSEIGVSTGWKIETGSFRATTARAGTKSVTANFRVVRNDVENAADRSWLGIQEVSVSVAAGAVKDNTDQTNKAVAKPHTAGPVIIIPAGQYVVVVRDNAWNSSHLNHVRTLFLGDYNVRAGNISVQAWDCMPDLGLIFDVTVDASPGIGGGGLMVLQSRDHTGTAIAKGTVGISEIMWSEDRGIPFGNLSNLQHAREQWIELHNTNTFDVKVTLFDLIRTEAYRTNDAGRAGLVDVMSNYDIGGRWDVQEKKDGAPKYGSDGNSQLGHDFIAMQRVAPAADKNYAHGEKQGRNKGHWSASPYVYLTRQAGLAGSGQVPAADLLYNFQGSPGRANTFTAPGPITRTNLAKNLIFNEVSNRRDQTLEWIELKNVSDAEINLRKYQISYVTAKGTDTLLYNFPDNDNIKLAAGEILLLLDTDPRDNDAHPIAVAFNRDGGNDQGLGIGPNAIKYKVANFAEGGLPNDGKFVLLLRNRNDRLKSHEGVLDAIGYDDNLKDDAIFTNLWPLKYFNGGLDARNSITVETVHRRQHVIDPDKNTHGDDKDEHQALRDVGYTGVGYKRHAQRIAAHGGTPGYEDTRKNLVADVTAATGALTISEIMYDQGDGRYPQWIEIYNSSSAPVNLHSEAGWRLVIENFDDGEIAIETLSGTLNFKNSDVQTILPNQTVMVTSTRARNSGSAFFDTRVVFPATRVFSVWDDQRGELTKQPDKNGRPTDPILSTEGFYIELIDGKGNVSDGVGNLVPSPNRRVAHDKVWELSEIAGGMMEDDGRSSILRRYRNLATKTRYSDAQILDMGITAAGWISAHATNFLDVRQTWYGHQDDVGSPGITGGRVLPVELSKFRPERLESGAVVIRWITESELNNAGFNILRSEKVDGEFKQINTKLIAGQGTTSERTTYTHTDTSAKPNVVYYYQIQDVSLDGKVQTLRMSRLKGHISAAGKATTTWGELKALRK